MGNRISHNSVGAGHKYTEAISQMKKSKDKAEVLRFLGMLKYIGRFIPYLSKITAQLRNLTRKDVEFEWNIQHDNEFNNLIGLISSNLVLATYDAKKSVIVQTDASKNGLTSGWKTLLQEWTYFKMVLLQDGKPVSFASRTLTKSEQKWAQNEKELLANVFSCQRFDYFLYGRDFTVQSDHKPLETLVKREIDDVTVRLQRMFLLLLKYPQMTVIYTPGKQMLIADCLSRAQLPETDGSLDLSGIVHMIINNICINDDNKEYYLRTPDGDQTYSKIKKFIEQGWPGYHQLDEL